MDRWKSWHVRLLSTACLSLAAKMEEFTAPALSQYNRVSADEFDFEAKVIERMELLVLKALDWRMNIITPFDCFCYFINKVHDGESKQKGLVFVRAAEHTLDVLKDVDFIEYPQSVIAATAVLAACDDYQLRGKLLDEKIDLISTYWGSSRKGQIYSCYKLMQKIVNFKRGNLNLPLKQTEGIDPTSVCDNKLCN